MAQVSRATTIKSGAMAYLDNDPYGGKHHPADQTPSCAGLSSRRAFLFTAVLPNLATMADIGNSIPVELFRDGQGCLTRGKVALRSSRAFAFQRDFKDIEDISLLMCRARLIPALPRGPVVFLLGGTYLPPGGDLGFRARNRPEGRPAPEGLLAKKNFFTAKGGKTR